MSDHNAKLHIGDKEISLPIITGSEQENAIDISSLRGSTGYVTLDVGFKNTGSTKSAITYLDGEQGILRHRGYSIEDLASKASFLEVSYLVINGKLPNQAELDAFDTDIRMHTLVNTDMENIFKSFPTGSHPMGQLMCLVSSLSAFYPGSLDTHPSPEKQAKTMTRLLAKMPTICAMIYKKKWGHPLVYPRNELDYVSNFLNMTFGQVTMNYEIDPVVAEAMNKLLILHADHEQNCSASTVRLVGSSHANLYSSVAAGIAALWGPLHGGANQQVIEMLENIKADGGNVQKFIDKAKEESINTILDYVDRKENGDVEKVIVAGCLSNRYKDDLKDEIPEVDAWFGSTHTDMPELVKELGVDYKKELVGERILTQGSHYAYLKIAEGCNRPCSFCAIPLMRGKHDSRSIEFLVDEAKFLVSKGVKEIMLIAQDLTYYGIDIYGKRRLDDLLNALADVEGLEWIRLHYAYPSGFPTEILKTMRERKEICNYLDIPLQHISDNVLKAMRRGINRDRTVALMRQIREEVPGITLRTTLLVGHPGETEEDHKELLDFIDEIKIDRVGVFTYSHEDNTHAGNAFEDLISEEVKQRRHDEIMAQQVDISFEINRAKIGKTFATIIDRHEDGVYYGRTEADSPEVDNEVIVRTEKLLSIGGFYDVKITDAMEYDLIGEVMG